MHNASETPRAGQTYQLWTLQRPRASWIWFVCIGLPLLDCYICDSHFKHVALIYPWTHGPVICRSESCIYVYFLLRNPAILVEIISFQKSMWHPNMIFRLKISNWQMKLKHRYYFISAIWNKWGMPRELQRIWMSRKIEHGEYKTAIRRSIELVNTFSPRTKKTSLTVFSRTADLLIN
jgi:hypothetical protein